MSIERRSSTHSGGRAVPAFVKPMAARSVRMLPEGADWLYEPKLDGYRALLIRDGRQVHILSRNGHALTRMYPTVAASALRLKADRAVIDGEIVALSENGRPSFQALQHRASHSRHRIVFYAFDVVHVDGRDLVDEPLVKRRARLTKIIVEDPSIRLSRDLPGSPHEIVRALRAAGVEGVIAKRRDSVYQPGERSSDWVKLKLERQQEFVIGGYRPDGPDRLDALLVGYYAGKSLQFAGKVRAGLVPYVRREVLALLKPLRRKRCPFTNLPDPGVSHWGGGINAAQMTEMQWTKPLLVTQIRFTEWTAENRLRHAAFLGLRSDKAAGEVKREP